MRRFSEVIEDLELKDLPLLGGPFNWSEGVNNQSLSRLDRLVNEEWDCRFSGSRQCVLLRPFFFYPFPYSFRWRRSEKRSLPF